MKKQVVVISLSATIALILCGVMFVFHQSRHLPFLTLVVFCLTIALMFLIKRILDRRREERILYKKVKRKYRELKALEVNKANLRYSELYYEYAESPNRLIKIEGTAILRYKRKVDESSFLTAKENEELRRIFEDTKVVMMNNCWRLMVRGFSETFSPLAA